MAAEGHRGEPLKAVSVVILTVGCESAFKPLGQGSSRRL